MWDRGHTRLCWSRQNPPLCTALNAMMAQGKKVIVASSTNQAINSIYIRFGEKEKRTIMLVGA